MALVWIVMSNCEIVTFPLVALVRCGALLYRFLIFALFLTLISVWKKVHAMKWLFIYRRDLVVCHVFIVCVFFALF